MADRTDNARVTASVVVKGVTLDLGTMDDRKGGASDSSSVVHNRGGMGPRQAKGGKPEPAPVTVARVLDTAALAYEKVLRAGAGRLSMLVKEQTLDDEGQDIPGALTVWTGKLKNVVSTDRDSEGSAVEMLELEMIVETVS